MSDDEKPIVHLRNVPDIEVATCGERCLPIKFTDKRRFLTCPRCIEIFDNPAHAQKRARKFRRAWTRGGAR